MCVSVVVYVCVCFAYLWVHLLQLILELIDLLRAEPFEDGILINVPWVTLGHLGWLVGVLRHTTTPQREGSVCRKGRRKQVSRSGFGNTAFF